MGEVPSLILYPRQVLKERDKEAKKEGSPWDGKALQELFGLIDARPSLTVDQPDRRETT